MNNQEWKVSKKAAEMLSALNEEHKCKFKVELQLFFIDCCKSKLYLLPHDEFKIALDLADKFASGSVSLEKVREYNWYTESAVFSMDYDTDTEKNLKIYNKIKDELGLPNILDARAFAISLGYFIDWSSLYLSDFDGKTPNNYEQFLEAELLRKRIDAPF
ncbi:MAG: hypothetical protein ABJH28_10895 [Paraglaciecola sp.]|uniref:hypothetical protein n=1 Tax=Paraglaciecola sp. TaxID=1920173 RepID=UPI003265C016